MTKYLSTDEYELSLFDTTPLANSMYNHNNREEKAKKKLITSSSVYLFNTETTYSIRPRVITHGKSLGYQGQRSGE